MPVPGITEALFIKGVSTYAKYIEMGINLQCKTNKNTEFKLKNVHQGFSIFNLEE